MMSLTICCTQGAYKTLKVVFYDHFYFPWFSRFSYWISKCARESGTGPLGALKWSPATKRVLVYAATNSMTFRDFTGSVHSQETATYLFNFQKSRILKYGHEWLDKRRLCSRLHAFTDNLMHTVTGTFTQQWHRQEPQQNFNKSIICNECDIDPWHIRTNDIETHADQRCMSLTICCLQTYTRYTDTFKRRLKTFLFCKFYEVPLPVDFM